MENKVDSILKMITYIYVVETNIFTDIKNGEEGITIESNDGQFQSVSDFIPYKGMLEFLKSLLEIDSYSFETGYEEYFIDEFPDLNEIHVIDQFKINLIKKLEETVFVDEMIKLIPDFEKAINESHSSIFKDKLTLFINRMKKKAQENKKTREISDDIKNHDKRVDEGFSLARKEREIIIENQEELKNYLRDLAKNSFYFILIGELLSYLLGIIGNVIANLVQGDCILTIDYRIILGIGIPSSMFISAVIAYFIYKKGLKIGNGTDKKGKT